MAQFVYSGLQGHGKSYEFVRSVVVPNVAKGRRIVTNVAGLQYDLICRYCVEKLGADPSKLGQIVTVSHEDIVKPNFFPREESENPFTLENPEYRKVYEKVYDAERDEFVSELGRKAQEWRDSFFVKGGDIVGIDECWRFYATGEKLPEHHLKFFRMHRHFVDPVTGQCCDIVLIVQDIDDLQRSIKATVEKSFLMQKHIDLGMPDRYVVNVYSGRRQTAKSFLESAQHKYDPEIFPLYKSHSQNTSAVQPKEERVEKRGSIFNRKIVRYGIPIGVTWIVAASWFMWRFFHPESKEQPGVVKQEKPGAPSPVSPPAPSKPVDNVSDRWVLVGYFRGSVGTSYVLSDGAGKTRFVSNPPAWKVTPGELELALPNGEIVTRWSGREQGGKR